MDIVLQDCPFHVGSMTWQPRPGISTLTVVCKATFQLRPGESTLAAQQDALSGDDAYWGDDPARSLRYTSDLVPAKPRADVVLVGQAFAPHKRPVRSLIARLAVGEINKRVGVLADHTLGEGGAVSEGPPFTQMPLVYERAAGGPDTWNPVGVRRGARDAQGRAALPNLVPPGAGPGDAVEPIGLGPIAPRWPHRLEKLGRHAATWSYRGWFQRPLPDAFDLGCFNIAPPDQQIAALRDDERIQLENLHPEHPALVTNLPGLGPRVTIAPRAGAEIPLPMRCDTLWIDTERCVCVLVWRGNLPLDPAHADGRILVGVTSTRAGRSPASKRHHLETTADSLPLAARGIVLPFLPSSPSTPPPSAPTAESAPSPSLPSPPRAPAESPWAGGVPRPAIAPLPAASIGAAAVAASAVATPAATPADRSPGAVAASNAAAQAVEPRKSTHPEPVPAKAPRPAPQPAPEAEPAEAYQMVYYDPESVPRMRKQAAWKPLLRALERAPLDADLDDPSMARDPIEIEDRREVFEIVVRGEPVDATGLQQALAGALRPDGKLVPPLLLFAGELSFLFEELETLRAAVTTATPLAATDDALRGPVEQAKDFLKTPGLLSSPAVAEGLTSRIRDAWNHGKRALPPGYLDAQIERALLEGRHYKKVEVLGDRCIKAHCALAGAAGPVPVYMTAAIVKRLPMYQRFKARFVAEAHLPLDQADTAPAALHLLALVRASAPPRR